MNNIPEPLKEYGKQVLNWVIIAVIFVVVAQFGLQDSVQVEVPQFPQPPIEVFVSPLVAQPEPESDTAVTYGYQTLIHGDGPDKLVAESGGEIELLSGGILDAQTGSVVGFDDVTIAGDLAVSGTTTWGITSPTLTDNLTLTGTLTAEDAVITDTLDVNGDIDLDGDGFDVNITAGFSIDADAASNINVAGAGIDLTLESEAGRVVVKGDEAAANAVTITANDAAGTGLTIDVGATGGVLISGGPTDIGGGTCGTAIGDNDLCVADALEVDGAADLDGTLIVDGAATFNHVSIDDWLTLDPATALSVTAGMVITPASSLQPLTSGAGVTCDTTTCILTSTFTAGDVLFLRNDNAADTITIDGTGGTVECKANVVMGAADILALLFDGTDWNCISFYDNS